jgi:hypothetical protein
VLDLDADVACQVWLARTRAMSVEIVALAATVRGASPSGPGVPAVAGW